MSTAAAPRFATTTVDVGSVRIGGGSPIVVQSMTNTDTADAESTARQIAALARAGSELVRITVDRDVAAKAVPHIRDRLVQMGVKVPIVGDFHYNGHTLLADNPACAEALDKYRINPGNVGFAGKKDRQFSSIVEAALRFGKPVRIGVNWGSLDQALLTKMMNDNSQLPRARCEARDGHAWKPWSSIRAVDNAAAAERTTAWRPTASDHFVCQGFRECRDLIDVYTAARLPLPTTPSTSASPKPGWVRKASSPRRRRWASCSSAASATRSATL